jgi:hypothetical protein
MIQSPRQFWISILILLCFGSVSELTAQSIGIHHSCLSIAGSSSNIEFGTTSFLIQESIGQGSVIGSSTRHGIILRQGFIQPRSISAYAVEEDPLSVLVYPNPASDHITIHLMEDEELDLNIALFDMSGRVVLNVHKIVRSELSIQLNQFARGSYTLRVIESKRLFTTNIQKL